MTKFTKIIATIGPSSESETRIEELIQAGVNIFRFNFKHNTVEWHGQMLERVRKVAEKLGIPVGTLIDLQGPEIRINMPFDSLSMKKGDFILFGPEAFEKKIGFSITHPSIIEHLSEGQRIVADDGAFTFTVRRKKDLTYLESHQDATLKNRKSLNIPGADFPLPSLVDRDLEGLKLAARREIDFVALSFVRTVEDLRAVRKEMSKYNVRARVFAKIETEKALHHLDEIINESDGIMVARGDLGVEMPIEQVPYYQKIMIKKSILQGKPVITATQMLESMIENPFPTRAEVSDIANATYDLTDAVMLSAESASGLYPVKAVEVMRKTAEFNEKKNLVDSRKRFDFPLEDQTSVMCDAAYGIYYEHKEKKKDIAGFLVFSQTGRTVQLLSGYHPLAPIFAFAHERHVANSLTINFGVLPFPDEDVLKNSEVRKEHINEALEMLKKKKYIKPGDKLIVLYGDRWAVEGGTSTIKLIVV